MRKVTRDELDNILKLHKMLLDQMEGGSRADLRYANLHSADLHGAALRGADLRYADLDFSVWFFGCKSFDVKAGKRLAAQLLYHFCRLNCDDDEVKAVQSSLAVSALANKFHRAAEC